MVHTRWCRLTLGLTALTLGVSPAPAHAETPSPETLKGAAVRAVSAIQASQATWYAKQACSSCHHQYQPAIAFAAAREHGIGVDERVAAANAAKAFDYSNIDVAAQYAGVVEPALHEGYRLVAAHAAGVRPSLATALSARILLSRQRPGGDWAGLNQRPPSSSSDFAKTAIALRAVQLFHHRADEEAAVRGVARAAAWLTTHEARDTESRTYQLLGLAWAGAPAAARNRVADVLAAAQHADGGWGSLDDRASEAYSTAEALVALQRGGAMRIEDEVWQRGLTFLLRTQAPDGTWHVPSRLHDPARLSPPYFESGYPYGHEQFISVAGAAWAIEALALALPSVTPSHAFAPADERAGALPIPAWIETVAFGTAAELQTMLDAGFNPNTTTDGKTTALMLAIPDTAKMRLLLDRGANPNALSASGYSPLAIAALHGDGAPAIGLLLEHGARGNPGAAVRVGVYALALAAHAGNADVLRRLHAVGDPVNARFRLSSNGGSPTPLNLAIRNGDVEVARTLLDLGARADTPGTEQWSPLESAVQNNRLDFARLFLERGADVNAVDAAGYTPLLLAVSIDFGDTAMLELLLKAGAKVDARTPDGRTALDLAREYGHERFLRLLTVP